MGNDVERRDRWVEFFTLVGMPQLRELRALLIPNTGTLEMLSHAQMDQLFPGLGGKWAEYSRAASVFFVDFYAYLGEFEAYFCTGGRNQIGQHSSLQLPCAIWE